MIQDQRLLLCSYTFDIGGWLPRVWKKRIERWLGCCDPFGSILIQYFILGAIGFPVYFKEKKKHSNVRRNSSYVKWKEINLQNYSLSKFFTGKVPTHHRLSISVASLPNIRQLSAYKTPIFSTRQNPQVDLAAPMLSNAQVPRHLLRSTNYLPN